GIRVFHVTGVQTCALPILPQLLRDDDGQLLGTVGVDHEGRDPYPGIDRHLQALALPDVFPRRDRDGCQHVGAGAPEFDDACPARWRRAGVGVQPDHGPGAGNPVTASTDRGTGEPEAIRARRQERLDRVGEHRAAAVHDLRDRVLHGDLLRRLHLLQDARFADDASDIVVAHQSRSFGSVGSWWPYTSTSTCCTSKSSWPAPLLSPAMSFNVTSPASVPRRFTAAFDQCVNPAPYGNRRS